MATAITAADVKKLRDATGAGMMDCKRALEEADGVVSHIFRGRCGARECADPPDRFLDQVHRKGTPSVATFATSLPMR